MQTPDIVNVTVMATVGVAFLQQQLSDHTASRVRQFEQIVAACAAVLQFLGRPKYLDSLFQLWSGLTHSLILMEALIFPEQPVQTSSQLALPRVKMQACTQCHVCSCFGLEKNSMAVFGWMERPTGLMFFKMDE